jgi:hypothetical protein
MSSRCGQKRAVRLEVQHLGDLADTGGHPGEIGGEFDSLRLVAAIFDAVGVGDGLSELAVPGTQFGELLLEALTGLVWVPRTVSRPLISAFRGRPTSRLQLAGPACSLAVALRLAYLALALWVPELCYRC